MALPLPPGFSKKVDPFHVIYPLLTLFFGNRPKQPCARLDKGFGDA
jgi:hypothetical protein